MSAVFRELVLNWKGSEYRVKPTMAILNRVEQDVSLSMLAFKITSGNPPLSQLATVIGHFLNAAGAKDVTAEDVYVEIMNGNKKIVGDMAAALMIAVFPQAGKAEAPTTTATSASGKRARAQK
jgi:hypothetical protein